MDVFALWWRLYLDHQGETAATRRGTWSWPFPNGAGSHLHKILWQCNLVWEPPQGLQRSLGEQKQIAYLLSGFFSSLSQLLFTFMVLHIGWAFFFLSCRQKRVGLCHFCAGREKGASHLYLSKHTEHRKSAFGISFWLTHHQCFYQKHLFTYK